MEVSSHLRAVWDGIRTSLWFVPLMMGGAVVLAAAGIWHDLNAFSAGSGRTFWWIYDSTPDQAREIISTLLSSMITMASLVFSITVVVLTLAASQFGPRLIRNFMASLPTQIVLGTFVMTILYCLIVLSAAGWMGNEGEFAFVTVTLAIVLMVVSIALLVLFIHTLARSIVSESVIERVGREIDETLHVLVPLDPQTMNEDLEDALPGDFEEACVRFGPRKPGYIQSIEFQTLIDAASRAGVMVRLSLRPREYVARNGRGAALYPEREDTPELREKLLGAIGVGVCRTPVQDIEYSIRHLVEVAVRALSPGINDPYTAVAALHRLSAFSKGL